MSRTPDTDFPAPEPPYMRLFLAASYYLSVLTLVQARDTMIRVRFR